MTTHPAALLQAYAEFQRGDAEAAWLTLNADFAALAGFADAWALRGVLARRRNDAVEAEKAYRQALAIHPGYGDVYANLGSLYQSAGFPVEAKAVLEEGLVRAAPDPVVRGRLLLTLGGVLFDLGELDAAIDNLQAAVAADPQNGQACNLLGKYCWELGEVDTAVDAFQKAVSCEPDNALFRINRLLVSQFLPSVSEHDLVALAADAAAAIKPLPGGVPPAPDAIPPSPAATATFPAAFSSAAAGPGRRLRIAYLSSDFRYSAPGYFIASIFAGHDVSAFEVYALHNVDLADNWSVVLRQRVEHWVEVARWSDEALLAWIRAERIDILVDLNGYTGGNRLRVFASRAATCQISWLGYEGPMAMQAIDGVLVDPQVAPAAVADCYAGGRLLLPVDFACYTAPDYAPAVAPTPALQSGQITFGSFNKLAKLDRETVALWAAVLRAVPGSRLLLKWKHATSPRVTGRLSRLFGEFGVAADRLLFRDASPHPQMLAEYGDIDIALDPCHFSGGATTCEALWMGVPVLSLRGRRFASSHSASHLLAAGFPQWLAESAADYVAIAAGLAGDIGRLQRLRQGMRRQIAESPLCSPQFFMRAAERELYECWLRCVAPSAQA